MFLTGRNRSLLESEFAAQTPTIVSVGKTNGFFLQHLPGNIKICKQPSKTAHAKQPSASLSLSVVQDFNI